MERKESAYFCSNCPLLKKLPEVNTAVTRGVTPEIRAEDITVASDPREVKGRVTEDPRVEQPERRTRRNPLLSKVFVIFTNVTQSNLEDVPAGKIIEMPTKSLIRNRAWFQRRVRSKAKNCAGPKEDVCPVATLIGAPRLSLPQNK